MNKDFENDDELFIPKKDTQRKKKQKKPVTKREVHPKNIHKKQKYPDRLIYDIVNISAVSLPDQEQRVDTWSS